MATDRNFRGLLTFRELLTAAAAANHSSLCVGFDPEPDRFPSPWTGDPKHIYDFCARVVQTTHKHVLAYKPQIAHFADYRAEGQLEELIAYIRQVAPDVPVILDAKRGDIGSTAEHSAREAFVRYQADAVTLSPFMGLDSFEPYLEYEGKGLFLLCRTSNPGGGDLQELRLEGGELLYEHIARLVAGPWAYDGRVGLIVGATYPEELLRVRQLAPTAPLLIPAIGTQGGSEAGAMAVWTGPGSIIVNSSRSILYPSRHPGEDYFDDVGRAADTTRVNLNSHLRKDA